jgi:hypothetical protein
MFWRKKPQTALDDLLDRHARLLASLPPTWREGLARHKAELAAGTTTHWSNCALLTAGTRCDCDLNRKKVNVRVLPNGDTIRWSAE